MKNSFKNTYESLRALYEDKDSTSAAFSFFGAATKAICKALSDLYQNKPLLRDYECDWLCLPALKDLKTETNATYNDGKNVYSCIKEYIDSTIKLYVSHWPYISLNFDLKHPVTLNGTNLPTNAVFYTLRDDADILKQAKDLLLDHYTISEVLRTIHSSLEVLAAEPTEADSFEIALDLNSFNVSQKPYIYTTDNVNYHVVPGYETLVFDATLMLSRCRSFSEITAVINSLRVIDQLSPSRVVLSVAEARTGADDAVHARELSPYYYKKLPECTEQMYNFLKNITLDKKYTDEDFLKLVVDPKYLDKLNELQIPIVFKVLLSEYDVKGQPFEQKHDSVKAINRYIYQEMVVVDRTPTIQDYHDALLRACGYLNVREALRAGELKISIDRMIESTVERVDLYVPTNGTDEYEDAGTDLTITMARLARRIREGDPETKEKSLKKIETSLAGEPYSLEWFNRFSGETGSYKGIGLTTELLDLMQDPSIMFKSFIVLSTDF